VIDPIEYHWSAHRAYLGLQSTPWLATDFALSLFGKEIDGRNPCDCCVLPSSA
jgi:hypothetical protein